MIIMKYNNKPIIEMKENKKYNQIKNTINKI